ncbi:MAG: hypothetical protein GF383_16170 [Candidatus Lokiarchaeota archaeon]|nr:hypothetical protein [Candidatus Lokiarchaeota archaeon]
MLDNTKLLTDKRNVLKKSWNWFQKEKETINALSTLVLVVVSFLLIIVTIFSIIATENVKDVTLLLEKERRIEKIQDNVELAKDLKFELENNENLISEYIQNLPATKTSDTHKLDVFQTVELENANNKIGFGNDAIRRITKSYIFVFDLLKTHIASSDRKQSAEKNNSIDKALALCNGIYQGNSNLINISTFRGLLDQYIKEENNKINQIEEFLFEDLTND